MLKLIKEKYGQPLRELFIVKMRELMAHSPDERMPVVVSPLGSPATSLAHASLSV